MLKHNKLNFLFLVHFLLGLLFCGAQIYAQTPTIFPGGNPEFAYYQVKVDPITGTSQLAYVRIPTGYVDVGTPTSTFNFVNAVGYYAATDLAVGLRDNTQRLVRIGSNGVFENMFGTNNVSGLPADNYPAGDVKGNRLYVVQGGTGSDTRTIYGIDIRNQDRLITYTRNTFFQYHQPIITSDTIREKLKDINDVKSVRFILLILRRDKFYQS